jgi:phthiocerol/phenolphthiocerol synthesis type-I polyketide synthase C
MTDGAIAIVGASCRFPGADGVAAFWRLLSDGGDAVGEVDARRWSTRFFYHPRRGEPGKTDTYAAGLIDGIDLFEPGFFGISPREAAEMDPQQRLLLELSWHAAEDAGIPAAKLAGTATGVYIGASSTDYGDLRLGDPASGDAHFVAGTTLSILANRVSHIFDLRGPSLVIDTACSSSLVALHQACQALRANQVPAAIVGGVNLLLSPYPFVGFAKAGMLSRRGRCHAFDARADGYVRGEGGGVVFLKRLDSALAAGDPIRAVILGTGVNSSGHTIGLSLPSETAQRELLREVYDGAGIAPDDLAFFEMHGTGTPAGDPVEAAAVGTALAQRRTRPLPIGSVKTNIGHLEPASGMAGLLKAVLSFEHGMLPRSLYCETPNPSVPFERLNLRLAGSAETLAPEAGHCAGVNSFGFGGANAHAIVGRAPAPRHSQETIETALPSLLISARSEAALRALAQEWRATLAATPAGRIPGLFSAAARRRDHHAHRLVVLADNAEAAETALGGFVAGHAAPTVVAGTALRDGGLAFVFSGNGAQWPGMGGSVYRGSAAFRAALGDVDDVLRRWLGWSVADRIAEGLEPEEIRRADIVQPALFAIQVGVVTVLRQLGVRPQSYLGHSVGEIAAAWAAGALSLDMAARIVAARGRRQQQTAGTGGMAALALTPAEAEAWLAELDNGLEIAALNSARSVTLSGPVAAIADLGSIAAKRGIAWRRLDLDFAFHSAAMDPIRHGILSDLADIESTPPGGHLASTVAGGLVGAERLDAEHWWRNIRQPVRFAEAAGALVSAGYRGFVEVGPSPVLQAYLREAISDADALGVVLTTLERRSDIADPFPTIAARVHVAGHDIGDAARFAGPADPRRLPLYPWQRERFWFARTVEGTDPTNPIHDHPLLGFRRGGGPLLSWVNHVDLMLFPWLADHRVGGMPVLPAAVVLDMALAAARIGRPEAETLTVADLELQRPLPIQSEASLELQAAMVSPDGDWHLSSRRRLADEALILHAAARLRAGGKFSTSPLVGSAAPIRMVEAPLLYRRAGQLGLDYGDNFRVVSRVEVLGSDQAAATLDPSKIVGASDAYVIHPVLLDGALQGMLALLNDGMPASGIGVVPWRFGQVRAMAPFGRVPCRAELRVTRRGAHTVAADIAIFDSDGAAIAELRECWFRQVALSRAAPAVERLARVELEPAPLAEPPAAAILDRIGTIIAELASRRSTGGAEQALLLDALVAAIAKEAVDEAGSAEAIPGWLNRLIERFEVIAEELPPAVELWRMSLAETPEMVAELALLAAASERLPRALRERSPLRHPASPMLDHLRRASPSTALGIEFLGEVLDRIAADWPRDRCLRILPLESDPVAEQLFRRLIQSGVQIRLITADNGGSEADLALLVNACAARRIDATVLADVRARLRPGGCLLAVGPMPSPLWSLVSGEAGPRSADAWRAMLEAAGFAEIGTASLVGGPWPSLVSWGRAPASNQPVAEISVMPMSIAVIPSGDAGRVARALTTRGHHVGRDLFAADVVVLAVGRSGSLARVAELMDRFAHAATATAERGIPLWLVTVGAQQSSDRADVLGAALWGFGRVLINEIPRLDLHLLDLPSTMPWVQRARCIASELKAAGPEREIVWTPAGRHVPRVRRGLPSRFTRPGEPISLVCDRSGAERLAWQPLARRPPGSGEIEIEVRAAELNFRDVMVATGLLPEEALLDGFASFTLGLECAGIVRAVGAEVGGIAIGDRVAGFAPSALSSHVVTRADAVMPIPPALSFATAATLPVAFVTAFYALGTLARLVPGETVLIHAAAGGVGLAALQYAKTLDAVVIATAGSATKRAFLRLAGADRVFDSRDLGFADAVRAVTGGRGVDTVLNSLSGDAMEASLELLKPFGRFVELGKRDVYENRRMRLRSLRHNIAHFTVDIDQLSAARPEVARSLLAELSAALTAGSIRPLAHRAFPFAQAAAAFRLMRSAGHIGKLVLVPDDRAGVPLDAAPEPVLRRDGAYVVTGGLDGFGFAAARWLARHGAGSIALLGRRGAVTSGAAERVAELEAEGATIAVHAVDVGERAALAEGLDQVRAALGPIRGVVHAASSGVDGMAGALSAASIAAGLRAKLGGALLLDELTRVDPIELFLLFSSATTLVGALGQGVYVAANAALETLARRRQAEGRPARAVAWGPIADAGWLAEHSDQREALVRRLGAKPIAAATALSGLAAMLASGLPVVTLAEIVPSPQSFALPLLTSPLFAEFRAAADAATPDAIDLEDIVGLGRDAARALLETVITEAAASVLRLPVADFDRHRPLAELGMDSLMAVELRLAVESRLRLDLPLAAIAEESSVVALARRLADGIAPTSRSDDITSLARRHEEGADLKRAAD